MYTSDLWFFNLIRFRATKRLYYSGGSILNTDDLHWLHARSSLALYGSS